MIYNIAIDGTSGAGKSTIAKILADKLGIVYLDTGAMYRAIAIKLDKYKASYSDDKKIAKIIGDTKLEIIMGIPQKVMLDGVDVSEAIREHHVSKLASDYSAVPIVRKKLVEIQQRIAADQSTILDGRDIGTHVLPNAKYKFFVSASPSVRAKRRYDELVAKGQDVNLAQIEADIVDRDTKDSTREVSPLRPASDAVVIDTSYMSIDEVVNTIMGHM